jgi:serpin B
MKLAAFCSILAVACGSSNAAGTFTPSPPDQASSSKPRDTAPTVTDDQVKSIAQSETAFAVDVYQALAAKGGPVFFSPHSIVVALMMTYAGARGQTAAEMRATLHLELDDATAHAAMDALDLALTSRGQGLTGVNGEPFALHVVDSLWGQKGFHFEQAYLDLLAQDYGAGLALVDYETDVEGARTEINNWVADATNDKIKDLLPMGSIDASTRLVLTNAVYFNAGWQSPFMASQTHDGDFHRADGSTVTAPIMNQDSEGMLFYQASGVVAASLPYVGNQLDMVVIVPDDLAAFEESLTADTLATILGGLAGGYDVNVHLPKWNMTVPADLGEVLIALGMRSAFEPSLADLSGIDGAHDLFIQSVIHKAFVAVDEQGTEAAAATAIGVGTSAAQQQGVLDATKPFMFLIRDRATGAVVFMGRVLDPTDSGS